jgi:hypothetical protein
MLMSHAIGQHFSLRQNTDGTVDSICLKCFMTVSNAESEADQARLEENHICTPHKVERSQVSKATVDESSSHVADPRA